MAAALLAQAPPVFVLLGHSLGGYVALQAALAEPARLAGLVLVSTSARAETEAARTARRALVGAAEADFAGVVEKLSRAALAREHRAAHQGEVATMMVEGGLARFAREQQAAATRPAPAERLGEISCPALVIAGTEDAVVDPAASRELAAGIAGAGLVELAGCGHMPHLESAAAFCGALQGWLYSAVR